MTEESRKQGNEFSRRVGPPVQWFPYPVPLPVSYFIAMRKKLELASLINSARFSLLWAYIKDHSDVGAKDQLSVFFLRTQYFKNALIWYSSSTDLLYQVVWFSLELHGISIDESDWYDRAEEQCKVDKLRKALLAKNSKKILPLLENLYVEMAPVYDLAKRLKHRGDIDFDGMIQYDWGFDYVHRNQQDQRVWQISDFLPQRLDLDEEIEKMIEVHKTLVDIAQKIVDILKPERALINVDEEGGVRPILSKEGAYLQNLLRPDF